MGGMALGSWLLPQADAERRASISRRRRARSRHRDPRPRDPARASLIQQVYLTLAEPGAGAITLRAIVCFLVLTPPTMLMGATLPAIARWLGRDDAAPRSGLIYMANLAGGATGTVLAGFYLLRVHDTVVATFVAVTINAIVARCLLAHGAASTQHLQHLRHPSHPRHRGTAGTPGTVGLCRGRAVRIHRAGR